MQDKLTTSDWVEYTLSPGVGHTLWQQPNWNRLFGVSFGVIPDIISQAQDEAFFQPCLLMPYSQDDFLPYSAYERSLPRYPSETAASHRARLHDAWRTWAEDAGNPDGLINQLTSCGVVVSNIITYLPPGGDLSRGIPVFPPSTQWWSQFSIIITTGEGSGSQGAIPYPGWTGGASTIVSQDLINSAQSIISKFKPVDWVCREIIVTNESEDWYWGKPGIDLEEGVGWGEEVDGLLEVEHFPARSNALKLTGQA
jgi:hypothetical protein